VPVQAVEQQSFGPEDIEILSNAFEEAVRELRLVDRTDPATQLVAKRIIELAQQGERDPIRLREGAVKATTVAVAASLLLSDPARSATAPFHPSRTARRQ
jgi:hypothetical protein